MKHITYLRRANEAAKAARASGNTPFGAVLVNGDGEVVMVQGNAEHDLNDATAHAEMTLASRASRTYPKSYLKDCTLYTTCEPCPMCTGAIINARIKTVYYGAPDLKAGSCGSVVNLFDLPYNHKPELVSGLMEQECTEELQKFFRQLRERKKLEKQLRKQAQMKDLNET